MWHVLSRSGVATLRTAIHLLLLLTYLLYNWYFYSRLDRKKRTRGYHYRWNYTEQTRTSEI